MGQEAEAKKRKKIFASYQVNEELMKRTPRGCYVSHCLPAHRGEEITAAVLDGSASLAFDEAENRLHAQKAVLLYLLGGTR
jgi:ornithine carbamoyltransferase